MLSATRCECVFNELTGFVIAGYGSENATQYSTPIVTRIRRRCTAIATLGIELLSKDMFDERDV